MHAATFDIPDFGAFADASPLLGTMLSQQMLPRAAGTTLPPSEL